MTEKVYVVPNINGSPRAIHTNPDCRYLNNAHKVLEKPKSAYPNREICPECSGTVERHRNTSENLSLFHKLSDPDFGPDNL